MSSPFTTDLIRRRAVDAGIPLVTDLKLAGAVQTHVSVDPGIPGAGIHEMGTARMGDDPATSVLNRYNQAHQVSNLFITDGACMTSSSCVNPSLTYMALTARAVDYAVGRLQGGAIALG